MSLSVDAAPVGDPGNVDSGVLNKGGLVVEEASAVEECALSGE